VDIASSVRASGRGGTSSEEDDSHVIVNLHHGAQCSWDEPQLGDGDSRFNFGSMILLIVRTVHWSMYLSFFYLSCTTLFASYLVTPFYPCDLHLEPRAFNAEQKSLFVFRESHSPQDLTCLPTITGGEVFNPSKHLVLKSIIGPSPSEPPPPFRLQNSRRDRRQTRIKHSLHIISVFLILLNLFINFSLPTLSPHLRVDFLKSWITHTALPPSFYFHTLHPALPCFNAHASAST